MAMNMTNINNDLAAGKDVRIDFKQMHNFGECARRAKQSGSEIILFYIDGVQPSILAQYTSQAPGQVTLERVFPADFGTLDLVKKGANLTCDNSKGSSLITDMVKAAKTSGAHVKFINCTRLSSFDINNLKKLGGDNVKFA